MYVCALESFYDTFHTVADMMYFCQMLALVETLNAAIGVTNSPVLPALIQFLGRNFILFLVFGTMEEMQNKAVVFFVFYSWSAIEIFRCVQMLAHRWSVCCCFAWSFIWFGTRITHARIPVSSALCSAKSDRFKAQIRAQTVGPKENQRMKDPFHYKFRVSLLCCKDPRPTRREGST